MMFHRFASTLVFVALMCSVSTGFSGENAPFSIALEDVRDSVLLGIPVVLDLKIQNISTTEQSYPKFSAMLRLDVLEAPPEAQRWLKADEEIGKESRLSYSDDLTAVPANWMKTTKRGFLPPVAGEYKVQVVLRFRETGRREAMCGESSDHWVGEVFTRVVTVKAHSPVGLDAQAFEAVSALAPGQSAFSPADRYTKAFWPGTTDAVDLLLGEFRESTYAAYKVYSVFVSQNPVGTNDAFVDSYRRQASDEGLMRTGGETWCNLAGQPSTKRKEWTRLRGKALIRCRDGWLEIALRHHPDIWFADEIRIKLALDHFLLGDKDSCAAGLKALADHCRADVASKAQDLLQAMQRKGMLPGAAEDQPVVSAKPKPCEPTDQ